MLLPHRSYRLLDTIPASIEDSVLTEIIAQEEFTTTQQQIVQLREVIHRAIAEFDQPTNSKNLLQQPAYPTGNRPTVRNSAISSFSPPQQHKKES